MKKIERADIKYVPDEHIVPEMVPHWDDGWYEILKFAHSAHGIFHKVSFEQECEIAQQWKFESMKEARIALRRFIKGSKYWSSADPTEEQKNRIINALESIRMFAQQNSKDQGPAQ